MHLELQGGAWFAVFDGHGGREVAQFCALHLHESFLAQPAFGAGRLEEALVDAFLHLDANIRTLPARRELQRLAEEGYAPEGAGAAPDSAGDEEPPECSAGTTSVVAFLHGGQLYVANAGDSRAVLCRAGGVAEALSEDHKPTNEGEKARILAAGGFVADGRVKGSLALSRAIGDLEFKATAGLGPEAQMVTAVPDVRCEPLKRGDEFLIIACDGIWDVLSSQARLVWWRRRVFFFAPVRSVAQLTPVLRPGGC